MKKLQVSRRVIFFKFWQYWTEKILQNLFFSERHRWAASLGGRGLIQPTKQTSALWIEAEEERRFNAVSNFKFFAVMKSIFNFGIVFFLVP